MKKSRKLKAIIKKLRQKFRRPREKSAEEVFVEAWSAALTDRADVFNGLYYGIYSIVKGMAKRPGRILQEWWMRTHYQWEGQPLEEISGTCLKLLTDASAQEECRKWAELLLEAARLADITHESERRLILDERNAGAYTEWNGKELYPDDEVEIMTPAWYQKGRILEQGHCRKTED